jgi:hypothetical protein
VSKKLVSKMKLDMKNNNNIHLGREIDVSWAFFALLVVVVEVPGAQTKAEAFVWAPFMGAVACG